MSIRQDALKRQYEERVSGNAAPMSKGFDGNGRPLPRVRPRNRFWRWFWLLFLITLLYGFLYGRKDIVQWYDRNFRQDGIAKPVTLQEALPAREAGRLDESVAKAYVEPSMAEMNQLCEYVRNAPNVRENAAYSRIMSSVEFYCQRDNNVVNAYAAIKKPEKESEKSVRIIVFCGGAARFSRVASLAVGAELCGDAGAARRFVNALKSSDLSNFSEATAIRLIGDAGLAVALADDKVVAKARSVSAGLMLGVIAHEAGHQALCHTLNTAKTVNLEVSRNQEREADSFASSVIASSPFGEYILAGTLFWHYAMAMQQGDEAVESTHPLSKERFENFVRANSELAASMGISLKK